MVGENIRLGHIDNRIELTWCHIGVFLGEFSVK